MGRLLRFDILHQKVAQHDLTPAQQRMYATEKITNFRTIAKVFATRSHYVLGVSDLASPELFVELAGLGQFADVAYAILEPTFVFANLEVLSKPSFPLEGYDALPGTVVVSSFVGKTAKLPAYVAYRTATRQLVVAFSGTVNIQQALYDLHYSKHKHPGGPGCAVHKGIWKMYKGCRTLAMEAVEKGLKEHDVAEVVITGHSLGGGIVSLLALDIVTGVYDSVLPLHVDLKVVGFGSPRVGNAKLAQLWRDALKAQSEKGRNIKEYLVKAYNDGVPALPPARFGYRHLTEHPVYLYHGRLFHIPPAESEHGIFSVADEVVTTTQMAAHPRGGHMYYNDRDLEGIARRAYWIADILKGDAEWESKYVARVAKYERKWKQQSADTPVTQDDSKAIE